jgi:hypothetical protein
LDEHGREAAASHVYNAWLDAGGEKGVVEAAIKEWLDEHGREAAASHVYKAWLDAGGEKGVVEAAIKEWLVEHSRETEAQFVYDAWLLADGDKGLVRDAIQNWLLIHREDVDADRLFRSWLEAHGERDLVWNAAIAWLSQHRAEESAVFVTKFIAKQPNLAENTVKDVLTWCRAFPKNEDALWRLTQLRDNLLVKGIAEDLVSTSEAVLLPLLPATTKPGRTTRAQIAALFFALVIPEEMQSTPLREKVDSLFLSWLKHPLSFGRDPHLFWTIQHPGFVERIASLINSRVLDPVGDREPLVRFLEWVDEWSSEAKQRVRLTLDKLKSEYGRSNLWEVVRFDEEELPASDNSEI